MITYTYDLDMVPGGVPVVVHLSQYDQDFGLVFNLYARDGAFSAPSGTTVAVRGTKSDGNGYSVAASISGTTVTVSGDQQMTAAAGKQPFELTLKYNGKELNTANFVLDVERAALDKDTLVSGSVIRELVDVIDRTDEIIAAAEQADSAVSSAQSLLVAVNKSKDEAAASATSAASSASTATTKASEATKSANNAAGSADVATQKAADAAASESTATKKAGEAAQSASSAEASATASGSNASAAAASAARAETLAQEVSDTKDDMSAMVTQALAAASNAENEVAEASNQLDGISKRVDALALAAEGYVDNGFVENGVAYFEHNGTVLFEITGIGGGGGGGGGGDTNNAVMTATNVSGFLSKTIADGGDCVVSITWSSIEDDMPTGNGSLRVTANGIVRATMEVAQGTASLDVAPYCAVGSNVVKVQISDVYGNARTINFSITVVALSISSTFDTSAPYTGAISFPYTPVGAVQKTVYFVLDGKEIGTQTTSVSGRQMSYTIPAQAHGAHAIRCYFEAEINGEAVRSNELYYEFVSVASGDNTVIITSSFHQTTAQQYASIVIPYTVYDPAGLTAEVVLAANGVQVSKQAVDRTEQSYTYRANDAGTLAFTISSGGTTKTLTVTVEESDIDVEAETEDLALYLSSQGRSNNEEEPGTWTYGTGAGAVAATFSGFNFSSDGWQTDADGITVLRVAGDARLTIPYQIFASDFRGTGKTIEIEFATRDVRDYDATILSCMSGGRGIQLTAQRATLKSEQTEVSTQYKEEEHIRIGFSVEKRSEDRLVVMYIDGVACNPAQYPADDDFSQTEPVGISIGSSDVTVDLYCIRVYDNGLNRYQMLDNWIADTQVGATMLDRYTRNNVYDAYGNVVIGQLPGDLPYFIAECPVLPQSKGDKKTAAGSFTSPQYPSRSYTFTGAQMDVQGTSSQGYPRKNYKVKFKGGFTVNGSQRDTWAMDAGAVPTDTFTFKADFASSEGVNNVELVRLYCDACPYITPAQAKDARIRQGIDGFPMVMFWNDGETTSFIGRYNYNNDKGTPEVFGFATPDESWEVLNNTSSRVLFKSADFTGADWLNDFEARFPDTDPAYEDSAQLAEFVAWAASTDTTAATGAALPEAVTYDGTEYTNDTAAYRLAKFKAEAWDYMERDSTLFYYLFTELFLMVDSRAKNAFPSFIGAEIADDEEAAA